MPPVVSDEYKEKKRKEILESAFEAFGEKGFQVSTIDDIVSLSGMSKGAIYNYFESKEEIYIQLMNMRTDQDFAKIDKQFADMKTATEKLTYLFSVYTRAESNLKWQNSIRVHIEFWITSSRQEELQKLMIDRYNHKYLSYLENVIQDGIDKGEFHESSDPRLVASLFWGIIDGVCLHYSVIGEQFAYKEILKKAEEIIFNYLIKR